jgi:endonuclease/exonuclease/phosphatase family metal-dependent hydrolase
VVIRVASYNVLADGYIRRSYYPLTPPAILIPEARRARVAERVAGLAADVVCLQEVEPPMLGAIAATLAEHRAEHEGKRGKPDGVATLSRHPVLERHVVEASDGTGHVALLVVLDFDGHRLGIANSHVKWDPPGARVGVAQVEALLDAVAQLPCDGWILAGDYNADPQSPLAELVRGRGWRDAYANAGSAFTCNSSQVPKRIDFLFHDARLVAEPEPLPGIDSSTALPSAVEPSDHLPIVAGFRFRVG